MYWEVKWSQKPLGCNAHKPFNKVKLKKFRFLKKVCAKTIIIRIKKTGKIMTKIKKTIKVLTSALVLSITSNSSAVINNKSNQAIRDFTDGRSEVTIANTNGFEHELRNIIKVSRTTKDTGAIVSLQTAIKSNTENDASISVGIARSLLVNGGKAIASINLFTDYEPKTKHKRISLGIEYQRKNFKASLNRYFAVSSEKITKGAQERALSGHDFRIIAQVPYLEWAKIKADIYRYGKDEGLAKGTGLGVDIKVTKSLSVEIGKNSGNASGAYYAKLILKLPFSQSEKFTNFRIAKQPFKDNDTMSLSDIGWTNRNNDIYTSKRDTQANKNTEYMIALRGLCGKAFDPVFYAVEYLNCVQKNRGPQYQFE